VGGAAEPGILTNVVAPGFTVTEDNLARFPDEVREHVRERTPSGRLSVPEDVAAAVVFLSSTANTNITGSSTVAALHAGRLRAAPTSQVTISGWSTSSALSGPVHPIDPRHEHDLPPIRIPVGHAPVRLPVGVLQTGSMPAAAILATRRCRAAASGK
jgi:hypothetical protein